MATWHIPLRSFDEALDGLFDFTFPPRRYLPSLDDWPLSSRHQHFDDDFRRQLIWPYVVRKPEGSKSYGTKEEGFKVELNVNHYKPDEISLKVEGQTLTVHGKHEHESEHGFEKSEFRRQYTLPQDVDARSVTSKITQDGILCVEAPKLAKALLPTNQALAAASDKLELAIDVSGYKPDEITVKVAGRNLIVHGEARKEEGEGGSQFVHHKQFNRQLTIPGDFDIDALSTRYTKEGKVIVEAPRLKSLPVSDRQLELKLEDVEEAKEGKAK